LGSIQNFIARATRKRNGTQPARLPNIGGSVNSSAAASQSSGRRGIAVSLHGCVRPLLLLVLMPQTNSTRAGTDENAPLQQRARRLCLADASHRGAARVRLRSPTAQVATTSLLRRENAVQKKQGARILQLRRQIVSS